MSIPIENAPLRTNQNLLPSDTLVAYAPGIDGAPNTLVRIPLEVALSATLSKTEADGLFRHVDYVQSFDALSGKPSTLAGYGISDALSFAQFALFVGASTPANLDTIYEIVAQLQSDESAFGTLTNVVSANKAASDAAFAGLDTRTTANATAIGSRLEKASNLSDLENKTTARANLGLGDSATKNVGVAGGVASFDDSIGGGASGPDFTSIYAYGGF